MILRSNRNNGLLATLFAGLVSFSVGCIIVGGNGNGDDPDECGSLLDNNYVGNDGFCYCDNGYSWCNPNDDFDLSCCEIDPKDPVGGVCGDNSYLADDGLCYCNQDYDWCSNTGLDCCPLDPKDPTETDGGGGTTQGGATSTGVGTSAGPNCNPEPPPGDSCTDGTVWCTHDVDCGGGGEYYECVSGAWQLQGADVLDQTCSFDFGGGKSFGCVDDPEMDQVVILCGDGSGDPCDADACQDEATLLACDYGVQTALIDCVTVCNDESFDNGVCGQQNDDPSNPFQCLCFDDTTSSGSSSGGSTGGSSGGGATTG